MTADVPISWFQVRLEISSEKLQSFLFRPVLWPWQDQLFVCFFILFFSPTADTNCQEIIVRVRFMVAGVKIVAVKMIESEEILQVLSHA